MTDIETRARRAAEELHAKIVKLWYDDVIPTEDEIAAIILQHVQNPAVACVKCGHKENNFSGKICLWGDSEPCGCKCEFPARPSKAQI